MIQSYKLNSLWCSLSLSLSSLKILQIHSTSSQFSIISPSLKLNPNEFIILRYFSSQKTSDFNKSFRSFFNFSRLHLPSQPQLKPATVIISHQ